MCSSAPDMSGANRAAEANAKISQEALDWYKQQYSDEAPVRAAASARAGAVSDAQLAAMQEATREAQGASDFQNRTLRPLQQSLVNEANTYDTEANRERLAGLALGDVNDQFAAARGESGRSLARMGVNPADGSFANSDRELTLSQALAGADAQNKTRQQATVYGHALKTDAAAALSGLPANAATQAGLALSSGNSSVGNAQIPLNVAMQGIGMMGQGFNTAIAGNNSAGNLYGQIGQIQNGTDSANASAMGGAGAAIGGIAMAI